MLKQSRGTLSPYMCDCQIEGSMSIVFHSGQRDQVEDVTLSPAEATLRVLLLYVCMRRILSTQLRASSCVPHNHSVIRQPGV